MIETFRGQMVKQSRGSKEQWGDRAGMPLPPMPQASPSSEWMTGFQLGTAVCWDKVGKRCCSAPPLAEFLSLDLFICIWNADLYREKERQRRKDLPSTILLPKWLQLSELGQSEARNQELLLVLPRECRELMIWAVFRCLPSALAESLIGSLNNRDLNQQLYGMLVLQAET